MEPSSQVEIQLGHMCNNRCVFCVSGQKTQLREAFPLDVGPILARVDEAFAKGHRKITLLGGEPTLQPGFMQVVERSVELGFEEIVIFTNGVKTSRPWFVDQVLKTGGNFTWRISIQGANKEAHDGTTNKPGSFGRILKTLENLREREQRITINMCVVRSNFESVPEFASLIAPFGVSQLHLDMMRPLDAGVRTEEEMKQMMPRYSEMAPAMREMVAGFEPGFDVNIGNLPYCISTELAPYIHHDGEHTETVTVDHDRLSQPWNKYLVKRRDKHKVERCADCVLESQCSGVFETYSRFYGTEELKPIRAEDLVRADPEGRHLRFQLLETLTAMEGWAPPAPFSGVRVTALHDRALLISLLGARDFSVTLRPRTQSGGLAGFDHFSVHAVRDQPVTDEVRPALEALLVRFRDLGHACTHPLGDDARGVRARSLDDRLRRLRGGAPYGELRWCGVRIDEAGNRAELDFLGPRDEEVLVWLAEDGRRATGGYRVREEDATVAVREGLRAIMDRVGGRP